jgi:hypothetical protein
MGGGNANEVKDLLDKNIRLIPVSCDDGGSLLHLYKNSEPLPEKGWVNYYRSDDFTSTAWFYLDKTESELPPLAAVCARI